MINNKCFDGAYYLCGYSIECALKTCIAKNIKLYDFPNRKLANECYTHDLEQLVRVASLKPQLDQQLKNADFQINWNLVKDWNENTRYRRNSKLEAIDLYYAVASRKHGILKWIKAHW